MAEKKRFLQIKENHLVMSSLGLSFVAPAFMRREKPDQVRVCSPEETDSEEEQLWTSGLTGARVWEPPTVRQPSTSDAVSVQSLSGRGWSDQEVSGGTSPSHPEIDPPGGGVERGSAVQEEVSLVLHEHKKGSSVYSRGRNLRNVVRVNYQEPEVSKDDDYFFCDECRTFFLEECEVHGPIVFMADHPVDVGEKDRAKKTLPAGFEVRGACEYVRHSACARVIIHRAVGGPGTLSQRHPPVTLITEGHAEEAMKRMRLQISTHIRETEKRKNKMDHSHTARLHDDNEPYEKMKNELKRVTAAVERLWLNWTGRKSPQRLEPRGPQNTNGQP
ncbi:unnamed protein product [Arctogadus glacialis]